MSPEQLRAYQFVQDFIPASPEEERTRQKMSSFFQQYDDLLFRENLKVHLTSSAFVLSPDRKKALLIYHRIYDSWSWAGGHADGEGNLLAVALREVAEETGCHAVPLSERPISLEILPVEAHLRRGCPVDRHLHLNTTFLLEADDSLPLTADPHETAGAAWFPLGKVLEASSEEHMKPVYANILRHIEEGFPY